MASDSQQNINGFIYLRYTSDQLFAWKIYLRTKLILTWLFVGRKSDFVRGGFIRWPGPTGGSFSPRCEMDD
jgi:hypothetical protein